MQGDLISRAEVLKMLKACLSGGESQYNYVKLHIDSISTAYDMEKVVAELKEYKDLEEQGLLLRLDSKDKLIEVLADKLLYSEFGACYMCTNPMKNITLDGVNNGCDGGCNTSEKFTVDDFLKKIVGELQRKEEAEQKLESMRKE